MHDLAGHTPLEGATVVFDLDGTIADTSGDLIDATNAALTAEGFRRADPGAILSAVGYGTKAMLRSALLTTGDVVDAAQMELLAWRLVSHYEDNIAVKTRLFPGFIEAARELALCGVKLVLCTNKREQLALKLLAALAIRPLFDAVAGGDTFPFHKPDPRHITELVRLAGGQLRRTIMVGDSEADVAAAKAAGIPVIAVRFGYAGAPLESLGANVVIDHFGELNSLVKALLRFP
jgi:phosphoglycolate phosphatase